MAKKRLTLKLTLEKIKFLKIQAIKDGITLSELIERLLIKWLEEEE